MAEVGDLVNYRGRWITLAPTHCPRGHRLGPGKALVGHMACQGHGGGGHTIWHCVTCPDDEPPTFGPPLAAHCTVMNGPAARNGYAQEPVEPQPIPEPPFME